MHENLLFQLPNLIDQQQSEELSEIAYNTLINQSVAFVFYLYSYKSS